MKNVFTIVLSAAIFMASCSGAEAKSIGDNKKQTAKTVTPSMPGKMNEFMAMLDGTEEGAKKAADTYFSDALKNSQAEDNGLTFTNYIMSDAKVVAANVPCCTMEVKAGVTTRSFEVCWEGDKINSIKDLGIK